jgi:RNase P/RNase MRP subunit p30
MVQLPKSSSSSEVKIQAQLIMKQLVERLASIGYTTIAFSHVVYGRLRPDDSVESISQLPVSATHKRGDLDESSIGSETDIHMSKGNTHSNIRIVKRLHAIVENSSDVGVYSNTNATESASTLSLLQEYDLVSLAPRNDVSFQLACSASEADIVTLDYTAGRGGVQIPFRIRPADVRAVVERGAAFELHYAPALLNVQQRKALVQTARSLQMASTGIRPKPRILFSSGDRTITGDVDMGPMALRSPGDLINLMQTVLGVEATTAHDAMRSSAIKVLERGPRRQAGQLQSRFAIDVVSESDFVRQSSAKDEFVEKSQEKKGEAVVENENAAEIGDRTTNDGLDDGFITL